jgi:hypothetical protein
MIKEREKRKETFHQMTRSPGKSNLSADSVRQIGKACRAVERAGRLARVEKKNMTNLHKLHFIASPTV